MKALLEDFARALVDEPAHVHVDERTEDGVVFLDLEVAESDRGKVIGKRGSTADALRTRDPDDIDILARITSDRSDAMTRLRDAPSIRPGTTIEGDEARRHALFALTNDFARLIYLHGQVAHFLTEMER